MPPFHPEAGEAMLFQRLGSVLIVLLRDTRTKREFRSLKR